MASLVSAEAWVTLVTNDSYGVGAMVLAHSLRRTSTTRQLAVIITADVSQGMREQLAAVFDHISVVDILDSNDEAHLAMLKRPDLGITFTKIHCWRLTQYTKCVFLDADTLVLLNSDELFERDELSAAPDVGWPDCFNSGVFVYVPSNDTFNSILNFALEQGSFDGGDQGLLNMYFSDWATKDIAKHLPFTFNMTSSSAYSYTPAYYLFGRNVRIVHFIGSIKPWMQGYNATTHKVIERDGTTHAVEHLQAWWDIFIADVQHKLDPNFAGIAGQLAMLSIGPHIHAAADERARQLAWESGHIDYMGLDAFENIQRKLDDSINTSGSS